MKDPLKQSAEVKSWLKNYEEDTLTRLIHWAKINSYTYNTAGLAEMLKAIKESFSTFDAEISEIPIDPHTKYNQQGIKEHFPLGNCLKIKSKTKGKPRVLLAIHMDTVYPPGTQQEIDRDGNILKGPGVADAKAGIAVILLALKALEHFKPNSLSWTVFLNSDEEIGSPSSYPLLKQQAEEHDVGMLYEPCLPSGNLIGPRKGSGNFQIIARGKSAHAGRDFHKGHNAITALSKCLLAIDSLNGKWENATFNIGTIQGGTAFNVVPDLAIAGLNLRFENKKHEQDITAELQRIIDDAASKSGYTCTIEGQIFSPPKIMDEQHSRMQEDLIQCGNDVGLDFDYEFSGGVCDGNKLSRFGLANIDTLGIQGGNMHHPDEYCITHSLTERAALSASFLLKIANGEINPRERYGY